MRITRKLQDVHQDLNLLAGQGKVKGFFNNIENAEKLGGLVEDIRDAMTEYQVCAFRRYVPDRTPDVRFRLRYSKIFITKVASLL